MNEFMQADDMLELLSEHVLYPPEYIELIAGTVARINSASLGYTAYLSVSSYVSVSILKHTDNQITADNIERFELFRSRLVKVDNALELRNLLSEVERFQP